MKKQQPNSRHTRSTSRYSINRIKSKQPKLKADNSPYFDSDLNKQNQSDNRNHNRSQLSQFGIPQTTRNHQEQALIDMNKRFNSQMAERQMTVMELKNALKKLELDNKKKEKGMIELESHLEAKNKMISTLSSQNASCSSAIEVLKVQSSQMTAENQSVVGQTALLKKQLAQKVMDYKKIEEQLEKTQKDLKIYNSLEPRLKELEELQDNLIEQNQQAKEEKEILTNTLKSIQRIIQNANELQPQLRQIETLITGFLD